MQFDITCVCGARVRVEAADFDAAVEPMVRAMDAHVAAQPHPQVPADLTPAQREGMVRGRMAAAG